MLCLKSKKIHKCIVKSNKLARNEFTFCKRVSFLSLKSQASQKSENKLCKKLSSLLLPLIWQHESLINALTHADRIYFKKYRPVNFPGDDKKHELKRVYCNT